MEGTIGLRRNFNPHVLTLVSEWGNKLRHGCAGMLLRKLAGSKLPPDVSVVELDHLAEAQLTGSQPAEGELSLTEGSKMLLSEMLDEEVRAQSFCAALPDGFCFVSRASTRYPVPSSRCICCLPLVAAILLSTDICYLLQDEIERFCKDVHQRPRLHQSPPARPLQILRT